MVTNVISRGHPSPILGAKSYELYPSPTIWASRAQWGCVAATGGNYCTCIPAFYVITFAETKKEPL